MAKTKKAEHPENITVVNSQIKVTNLVRTKIEVQSWRKALQSAENVFQPYRAELYRVYQDLWVDAHFRAITQKRIRNVKNKKIVLRSENQEIDPKINKLIEKMWFYELIELIMETLFWGHSLIEIQTKGYEVKSIKLVPRHHVRPEYGIITLQSVYDMTGINFRDAPDANYLIEVDWGFGLMNIAAANVIYKKYGVIDYANFVEIFGSPIREFRYDNKYPGAKDEADNLAEKQGNSAAVSLPKDSVEFTIHKGADGNSGGLHKDFIEMLKDELTILVLGQTMTTKDGSSRSQGEVHLEEQDEVTQDDMMRVILFLNEMVKPKLVGLGFPIENLTFEFLKNKKLPIKEQLEIALKVAEKVRIDDEYWYDLAGIPKPKGDTSIEPDPATDPNNEDAEAKKKTLTSKKPS